MKWQDARKIAIELAEKYPEIDPLTLRFTELHQYVCDLETFEDDPQASNEGILEAIQVAWIDETE